MVRIPETQQKELYASQGIYTSDINFRPEVRSQYHFPPTGKIRLRDITLREEIAMDKAISLEGKVRLADKLQELGIHIIQIHAVNLRETVAAMRKAGVKTELEVMGRTFHPYYYSNWQEMIDDYIKCGVDCIHLTTSNPQRLMTSHGWSLEECISIPQEAVRYAKKQGAGLVELACTDAPRTDIDYLKKLFVAVIQAGADRISAPDSPGCLSPVATKWFIQEIRSVVNVPISVHCHNDFGLGTANILASLEAGAEILDVVTNGADPVRSGIASLDEVVMAMKCLYGIDVGIKTEMLYEFARWFVDLVGVPMAPQKPVVSDPQWRIPYEHAYKAMAQGRYSMFPFSASLVGLDHRRPAYLNRAAGTYCVSMKLEELGIPLPAQEKIEALAEMVRQEATAKSRGVTDNEFRKMVQKIEK